MPLLPYDTAAAVGRDGLSRVVTADDGTRHVLYLEKGTVRSMLAGDWPPPLPTEPTEADIAAAIAAREAAERQAEADAAALRQKVVTVAQSAVGQTIDNLTAGQVRALMAVLLWKAGALDKTGAVQPLGSWDI